MPGQTGRWTQATRLRDWGTVALSCASGPGGGEVILAEGAPSRVAQLRDRHDRVRHPAVPRVADQGEAGWLALEGGAVGDLQGAWETARRREVRLGYKEALAIGLTLSEAVGALHAATGEALGAVAWSNVLVSRRGRLAVLLIPPPDERTGCAPEVAAGTVPTPSSDVFALLTLFQTLRPLVAVPEAQRALLAGTARAEGWEARFLEVHRRALAPLAADRFADVPTAIAAWRAMWAELGVTPRPEQAEAMVAGLVGGRLVAGRDGSRFELPGGTRVELERRPVLQRMMACLLAARLARPGQRISLAELIEAAWPGERLLQHAGRNRAHVSLAKLRALGLRDLILTDEAGYCLDPSVPVDVA